MTTHDVSLADTPEKISHAALASYILGGIGDNVICTMIVTFLMMYYTDYVGIPATTVGTLFLITRIWDTFSDLVWGWIFDNTHTRLGRFRPWLLYSGIVCALSLIATYSIPQMSMAATIAWAAVTYFLLSTSYTAFDVPYWSLATVITRDPRRRNHIVVATRIGGTCGSWLASVITLPLLAILSNNWSQLAVIYALFFLACALVNFAGVRELPTPPRKERALHTWRVYPELLRHNRPLVLLMGFWFLLNVVLASRAGFCLYYFKYQAHSEAAMSSYLGASTLAAMTGAALTPFLVNRFDRKVMGCATCALAGLLCVLVFFTPNVSLWLSVTLNSAPHLLFGILGVLLGTLLPDVAAWHEYHHHRQAGGMIFSLNLFQLKFSGAIGGAAAGFVLGLLGYVPNVAQTAFTLTGINASFTLIPGVLLLISPFILSRYPLTRAENQRIASTLQQRDAQESIL